MSVPARSVAGSAPTISIRNYAIVTAAYWAFTLTDGALRMLVLLHFNQLGYTPVQLAFLFLLYEFFGIVTNLVGGWIASRTGVRFTLVVGLMLQVVALGLLAFLNRGWSVAVSVAYVMGCQALSGIAKDLTKMSAKSAVKVLVPKGDDSGLFKWVAVLTGSKNALKGAGFFVGGFLLSALGFRGALSVMATGVLIVLLLVLAFLPAAIGQAKKKARVHGHSLQLQGHQPSVAGAARVVRSTRRVVCRQRSDLPGERAWLVLRAGRRVHGAVGHRLWRRAECFSGVARARRLAVRRQGQCSRARSASASLRSPP